MREIILKKRYPHSREEDITDAFMRGYEKGKADRPQDDEFKNFDRGDLIALIEAQKERIGELLTDRPQGEWIESFKRVEVKQGAYIGAKFVHDGWSCSECSEIVEKRYPNCPYCLARMKGADDEYDK